MSEGRSGCLFSLGARSAAGCSGKASCGDASCGDRGVVVGEGERSGCDGCGGVLAGDVGVGEMWFGEESRGCGGGVTNGPKCIGNEFESSWKRWRGKQSVIGKVTVPLKTSKCDNLIGM